MPDQAAPTGTVRVSRRFDASPERVFQAFVRPDQLVQWFWPHRFATDVAIDLRPGGAYHLRSTGLPAGQNMGFTGRIVEVSPPGRLVMTWRWDGEDDETTVTITVRAVATGTSEVVVTHEGFATAAERDNHAEGWDDCLDRLVELLAAVGQP